MLKRRLTDLKVDRDVELLAAQTAERGLRRFALGHSPAGELVDSSRVIRGFDDEKLVRPVSQQGSGFGPSVLRLTRHEQGRYKSVLAVSIRVVIFLARLRGMDSPRP